MQPFPTTPEGWAEGFTLIINKPLGWTSFDVVGRVRSLINIKKLKVGHAGTLDPLASGVLVVCTGKHTKGIDAIQAQPKAYEALVRFGAVTDSYDLETPERDHKDISHLTPAMVTEALAQFRGEISQIPPVFSAVKVDGQRAYAAARAGKDIEIQARKVTIYELEVLEMNLPYVRLHVGCSKGTYIRSLAHDLGQALGTGAYLAGLVRTRVGDFTVEEAIEPEAFGVALYGEAQPRKREWRGEKAPITAVE